MRKRGRGIPDPEDHQEVACVRQSRDFIELRTENFDSLSLFWEERFARQPLEMGEEDWEATEWLQGQFF